MGYAYLEHTADMGIRADGASLAEAAESAMDAVINLVYAPLEVSPTVTVEIRATAPAPELLLVEFINETLSMADLMGLAMRRVEGVSITEGAHGYEISATLVGEPFDPKRHAVKTEVKGATYSGLSYGVTDGRHAFTCVLDL